MSAAYDKWFNEERDPRAEWCEVLESAWNAGYAQFFKDNPLTNEIIGTPRLGEQFADPKREDLLRMTQEIVLLGLSKLDRTDLMLTGDAMDGFEVMIRKAQNERAKVAAMQAAAIIAEVDRVSGGKP